MTSLAVGLILIAAVLHASWNFLAKHAAGGAVFTWLFGVMAVVVYFPVALWVLIYQHPPLGPMQILFILISACIHLAYFLLLQTGYRLGDLSLVYPLARGSGPMLATLTAIVLFGERPTPLALFGAFLVIAGVFLLTGGMTILRTRRAGPAVRFGLLTGVTIAAYTLSDKYAVSTLNVSPVLLDYGSHLGRLVLLTPFALRHWERVQFDWRHHWREALGIAVLSPLAYMLILTAMIFTPVSYVAPACEVSILIGAIIGAHFLEEGQVVRRLAAASCIVLGVIALALG